jgi:hypothetical protein
MLRPGSSRHGRWTKYVDDCLPTAEQNPALARDYSPRTGRILPKCGAENNPRLTIAESGRAVSSGGWGLSARVRGVA